MGLQVPLPISHRYLWRLPFWQHELTMKRRYLEEVRAEGTGFAGELLQVLPPVRKYPKLAGGKAHQASRLEIPHLYILPCFHP